MDLHAILVKCANEEGFPLANTVDLDLAFSSEYSQQNHIRHHIEHYDQWIKSGFAGSMEYLVRGRDRRADPRLLFPQAQSILCVAIPYPKRPAGSTDSTGGPRYARYLQGNDYHIEISEKLERVMQAAKSQWTRSGEIEKSCNNEVAEGPSAQVPRSQTSPTLVQPSTLEWKICVDTSAVLERSWAALAGLGWIGKNTLLIHPRYGSYLFLGEVLINQKTERGPAPLPNYCGHCTRCLEACPTQAFQKPHVLDSNRCVSYLTLEKRGELPVSTEDKQKFGSWVAGCDICQEVCPFNRKPTQTALLEGEDIPSGNATTLQAWQELLLEDVVAYKTRVKNSALNRIKPAQFSRNLAIALTNSLRNAAPPEIQGLISTLGPFILMRLEEESDEFARVEWQKCIELIQAKKSTRAVALAEVDHE